MRTRTRTWTLTIVIAAAIVGLGAAPRALREPARELAAAVQFVGHDSKIETPRQVLITDEAAWAKLWAEHTGIEATFSPPLRNAVPRMDFTRFMVVGVFRGKTVNSDGEIASGVLIGDDAVRVRYERSTFQTMSAGPGPDKGQQTQPFGIFVIDRSNKLVVLEEGRRSLKNQPLKWTEVKRFEARQAP